MRAQAVVLAAGGGERLGRGPKALVRLCGTTLVGRAVGAAAAARLVDAVIVVAPPDLVAEVSDEARRAVPDPGKPVTVVAGGATRQASARNGLAAVTAAAVVVHDAARALCPGELFDRCLDALDTADAVLPVMPIADTLKRLDPAGAVAATIDRRALAVAQTPQAFRTDVYRRAHEAALRDGVDATDDAALAERIGVTVVTVPGVGWNLKITTPDDLRVAELWAGSGV